ncbi:MAG TPA: RagB/SusD family nutrient uptake outer membrane protein [Gemmatimonadaceae bacterium]|nr:RagB/SusD family nutrient uptake outer membrane protein [Gemmatimonadaceae bacterium]
MTPMPYRRLATAVGIAVLLAACSTSDLLKVQAPNSVPSDIYSNPAYATLMVNSVIGDFECGFGSFVVAEGIASDELHDASLNNGNWNLDRRDNGFTNGFYGVNSCTTQTGIYTPLSTARGEADAALKSLGGWTPAQVSNLPALTAQANLYSGFSYAALGQSMCQAAFDMGPLVDQKGMFKLAETRFTAAIAAAQTAGLTNVLNAAYAGRARVRLFMHDLTGAIADAQLVPAGFVFNAAMDATNARRFNHVFQAISTSGNATVETTARALTTETGQADPRSAMVLLKTAPADGLAQIYIPAKYNAATLTAGEALPMPITRYAEAQLILAEAQGGANAVSVINTMRAAVGLNPYAGPTDAASITALIASERQRVLFLEGFRAFDIERLALALVPAAGSPYLQGGVYGATVCLPVPDIERDNNPNIVASQIISGVRGEFAVP